MNNGYLKPCDVAEPSMELTLSETFLSSIPARSATETFTIAEEPSCT